MSPFEDLIKQLGQQMGLHLKVDSHESCKLLFRGNIAIQIDLAPNADAILVGAELGTLVPGPYRNRIFTQALIMNGALKTAKGFLSFSEKKDSLVLFQFIPLYNLTGEKLLPFLHNFTDHAATWIDHIKRGEIPEIIQESDAALKPAPFGLR